jgi:Xaa-Pro aminopeptidase
VASGPRIWHAHYFRNDAVLSDGDLVLMDYAPDFRYYTSDIGRMWPVNGRYSPAQRELYGFMIRYHQALLSRIHPGRVASEILRMPPARWPK